MGSYAILQLHGKLYSEIFKLIFFKLFDSEVKTSLLGAR